MSSTLTTMERKILHCEHCGDSWYDSGISNASCPTCRIAELQRERDELQREKDEALQITESFSSLRELANEGVRATMPDDLRAEFETWAHNKLHLQERRGVYETFSTQAAWEAYRAAHASGCKAGLEKARALVDAEPVPEGDAPIEIIVKASNTPQGIGEIVRGAVRATKKNIASAIQREIEK